MRRAPSPALWLLGMMPQSRRAQAFVAEVLSQALASGMSIIEALEAASDAMRGSRFQVFFQRVAGSVSAGEELADSFQWAGMHLHEDLRAAIEVGETSGNLSVELAAGARLLDPLVRMHVAAAIGRRSSASHFAVALARLLSQLPMTTSVLHDAARLVGGRDRCFRRVIEWLALDVEGGSSLADALARYPEVFDPLFLRCIAHAESRESMRRILKRLSDNESEIVLDRL